MNVRLLGRNFSAAPIKPTGATRASSTQGLKSSTRMRDAPRSRCWFQPRARRAMFIPGAMPTKRKSRSTMTSRPRLDASDRFGNYERSSLLPCMSCSYRQRRNCSPAATRIFAKAGRPPVAPSLNAATENDPVLRDPEDRIWWISTTISPIWNASSGGGG